MWIQPIKFFSFSTITLLLLLSVFQAKADDILLGDESRNDILILVNENYTGKRLKASDYFDSIMENYVRRLSEQCVFTQRMPSILYNFMRKERFRKICKISEKGIQSFARSVDSFNLSEECRDGDINCFVSKKACENALLQSSLCKNAFINDFLISR
jgi:hypothetical protein